MNTPFNTKAATAFVCRVFERFKRNIAKNDPINFESCDSNSVILNKGDGVPKLKDSQSFTKESLRATLAELHYLGDFDELDVQYLFDFLEMAADKVDFSDFSPTKGKSFIKALDKVTKHLVSAHSILKKLDGVPSTGSELIVKTIIFVRSVGSEVKSKMPIRGGPKKYLQRFLLAAVAKLFLNKSEKVLGGGKFTKGEILERCDKFLLKMIPEVYPVPKKERKVAGARLGGYLVEFCEGCELDINEYGLCFSRAELDTSVDSLMPVTSEPRGNKTVERAARILGAKICYFE